MSKKEVPVIEEEIESTAPMTDEEADEALEELIPGFKELKAAMPDMAASAALVADKPIEVSEDDRLLLNLLGGMAGASVSGRLQNRYEKAIQDRIARLVSQVPAAPSAPNIPAAPGAPGAPGVPSAARPVGPASPVQLGEPGTYGRGVGPGQMTFNYGRAAGLPEIEAARALGMGSQSGEVHDLLQRRREALQTIQQRFPSSQFVENPRFGGVMTPDQGVGRGPRESFVQSQTGGMRSVPPPAPVPTAPPPAGALTRARQAIGTGARVAGGTALDLLSSPRVVGAGAGVGAAEAAQQYYGRRETDPVGAYLAAGTGALGGLAALPVLPMPARVLLAGASPLTMYLYDKYKPYRSVLESTLSPPPDPQRTRSEVVGP